MKNRVITWMIFLMISISFTACNGDKNSDQDHSSKTKENQSFPLETKPVEEKKFDFPDEILGKYNPNSEIYDSYMIIEKDKVSVCVEGTTYEFTPEDSLVFMNKEDSEIQVYRNDKAVSIVVHNMFNDQGTTFDFYQDGKYINGYTAYSQEYIRKLNSK